MINNVILKGTVIMTSLLFMTGCAATKNVNNPVVKNAERIYVINPNASRYHNTKPYTLHAGDMIDVKFFYTPELNETLTIRPDGMITLQLVGDVKAAGRTPSELDEFLTDKFSKELKQVEIAVIVKTFSEHKVYIGGEVERPGVISLNGRLTTLQAIFNVGGFKNTAEEKSVLIIRKGDTSDPVEFLTIDLHGVLEMERDDIYLHPFDVVYVPKSPIAEVNLFVSQYINQIIPPSLAQIVQGFFYLETIKAVNE